MDFSQKYQLIELLPGDGVQSYRARQTNTGRDVTVHLLVGGKTPENEAFLVRLRAMHPQTPVSVFVFLRNVHLLQESPPRLGAQRVRRVPVQYRHHIVQPDPRLLLVDLGCAAELDTLLRSAGNRIESPVPDLRVLGFANTASLISPCSSRG